jgi:ubiquinone/menaquinone biosynthesis C-methylase UbiE
MTDANDRVMNIADAHKLENPDRVQWLPPDEILGHLPLRPGAVVADIGAGTGYFALPLARAVGPKGRVLAVDLQIEMLELLRAKLNVSDAPANIELVHGRADATTLSDCSCDVVFIANVWHELPDHDAALREFRRVLKPGGSLTVVDWRPDTVHPPGPPLEHRIPQSAVVTKIKDAEWEILSETSVGKYSYFILAEPR